MHGFWGRLLHVDLSTGKHRRLPLDEAYLRRCLGGIGLGTSLLYRFAAPGADALSPANPLIFATAPLVDTGLTTTAKFAVVTKSPLTGFIADSLSSSFFALELKRAALDALVVTGRASRPVYLWLSEEAVEVRDASSLVGKSPAETEVTLRRELGDDEVRVASIGLAGENLARFATISNEGRHAGRGGVGAVMGSKNLKAVAVRGRSMIPVADPRGVEAEAASLRQRSLGPLTAKYRGLGTVANLSVFNRLGTLPTRNFREATFEGADDLAGETLHETRFSKRHGCAGCTIRCEHLFRSLGGDPQRLEYETLFALGPLCGVRDPDAVLRAAQLCDLYGLDTISTGGTVAWAMECTERGLLSGNEDLRFGNAEALVAVIPKIAARSAVGALLAEGSKRAARRIGRGADDLAMHVKGLELPGYEPRSLKSMALGLAVNPRGACHNRSGAYEIDFSGEVDRFRGGAERGVLVAAAEDFAAVLDSLIVCKFLRKCFEDFYGEAARLLEKVTGWSFSATELREVGRRVSTLKRLFNIREGWKPEDDWLPPRCLRESVAAGPAPEARVGAAELKEMIQAYYRARGWDERGRIPPARIAELDLDGLVGAPAGRTGGLPAEQLAGADG